MAFAMQLFSNVYSASAPQFEPYTRSAVNSVVVIDTSEDYDQKTVAKVLAARGKLDSQAPPGAEEFLDWLNS